MLSISNPIRCGGAAYYDALCGDDYYTVGTELPGVWFGRGSADLGLSGTVEKEKYTAVLGDAAARRFEAEITRYQQAGFRDFKIKLSGNLQRDLYKVVLLKAAGIAPEAVRADANNLWADDEDAIRFLSGLDYRFNALEEPLRAGDHAGMNRIAEETGCSIILDESLLRADQLSSFSDSPMRWIVNLRISKMGGLIRSLEQIGRAHV